MAGRICGGVRRKTRTAGRALAQAMDGLAVLSGPAKADKHGDSPGFWGLPAFESPSDGHLQSASRTLAFRARYGELAWLPAGSGVLQQGSALGREVSVLSAEAGQLGLGRYRVLLRHSPSGCELDGVRGGGRLRRLPRVRPDGATPLGRTRPGVGLLSRRHSFHWLPPVDRAGGDGSIRWAHL